MYRLAHWVGFLGLLAGTGPLPAQTAGDLFDGSVLQEVRLFLHPTDWQKLKDNFEENDYYPAEMAWRGQIARDIGIRSRGGGSRNGVKPGLRVDFDRFNPDARFLGLKSIILDNLVQDPSMMKETVAMRFFSRMGLPASREAHARLFVNNEYLGLYVIVESVDRNFLKRHFDEDSGFLYEYVWSEEYRFEYRGPDPADYSPVLFKPQTREKDPDPAPIEAMIRTIHQASDEDFVTAVSEFLDLKLFLTHVAIENFLAEWDGILGDFGMNNFFFYRFANRNLSQFVVWDKDVLFVDSEFPIFRHASENILTRRALAVPELREAYLQVLERCAEAAGEAGGWMENEMIRQHNLIATAARTDPVKPYDNEEFAFAAGALLEFARNRSPFVRQEVQAAREGR